MKKGFVPIGLGVAVLFIIGLAIFFWIRVVQPRIAESITNNATDKLQMLDLWSAAKNGEKNNQPTATPAVKSEEIDELQKDLDAIKDTDSGVVIDELNQL